MRQINIRQILKKIKEYLYIPTFLLALCSIVLCGMLYARLAAFNELYNSLATQVTQIGDEQNVLVAALDNQKQSTDGILARLSGLDEQQTVIIGRLDIVEEKIPLATAPAPVIIRQVAPPAAVVAEEPVKTEEIADEEVPLAEEVIEEELVDDGTVKAGDKFVVTISSAQVKDLFAYQFKLYYDDEMFESKASLKSSISEITTIFYKPFDGYLLVGATKIGQAAGYSANDVNVCQITLQAKQDGAVPKFSLDEVNVVDSKLVYDKGIKNWTLDTQPLK